MIKIYKLIFLGLFCIFTPSLFGQILTGEQPKSCVKNTSVKGKYKILSIGKGVETQFYLEIKPKYRTVENYIAIAKEFKERYCEEDQLRIIYLKSKNQWLILDPNNPEATPLAIFYADQNTIEKEGLTLYEVFNGKVAIRELKIESRKNERVE